MRVIKKRGEKTGEDLLRYSIQRATSRFTIFKWWRGKSEKNYSLILCYESIISIYQMRDWQASFLEAGKILSYSIANLWEFSEKKKKKEKEKAKSLNKKNKYYSHPSLSSSRSVSSLFSSSAISPPFN